jgi:hypothetical protein
VEGASQEDRGAMTPLIVSTVFAISGVVELILVFLPQEVLDLLDVLVW